MGQEGCDGAALWQVALDPAYRPSVEQEDQNGQIQHGACPAYSTRAGEVLLQIKPYLCIHIVSVLSKML